MTLSDVLAAVYDALSSIRTSSGRSVSGLHGGTTPLHELEGFDSINAAEASCMLENSLGHSFPPELLLFGTASQPRTVDEIIDQVCEIAGVQGDETTSSSEGSNNTTVASRLRMAREQAGLSQGQVAKLMKMHRPTISEIEAGRRKVSAEEIAQFSRLYDISVVWLTNAEETDDIGTGLISCA